MRTHKVTRGPHYIADATMSVSELAGNSFYILFPAKGIMNYRQIISSRLYVRISQLWPSEELIYSLAEHFSTPVNELNNVNVIHFIHLHAVFPLGRVAGATDLGGLEIPHGQQQFQVVLLGPHQDGTKQSYRCSHSTSTFADLWADLPWVQPAGRALPAFFLWGILDT